MQLEVCMMKKWFFILLTITLFSILVMSSCSEAVTSTTSTVPTTAAAKTTTAAPATTTNAAQYGGTLTILTTLKMTNVGDPSQNLQLADRLYSLPACEFLTSRDNKDVSVIPHLATAWQVSPDNKSVTFTLRKGVKFQDGTDFNAAAVQYNLNLVLNAKLSVFANVSSVDLVDDYTVRINLTKFDKDILAGYVQVGIASPTAYQKLGKDAMFHAVGTGPYQFVSYTPDVRLIYERNDNYWGGKPYLDKMVIEFIANETTQIAVFKAGTGNAIFRLDEFGVSALQPLGFKVNASPTAAWGIVSNSKDPNSPFSNIKVRQAVSYAIDTGAIAKALSYGVPSQINQFAARPEVPGSAYNPNVVGYPYNEAKAKQLLTEAGYPNGFNTTLFTLNEQWFLDMCQSIAGYLSNVGIKVQINQADGAHWSTALRAEISGMAVNYITVNPLDNTADQFYYQLGGLSGDAGGKWPMVNMPSDYLALVQKVVVEPDAAKRTLLFQQMNKLIIDQYCLATPIFTGTSSGVYNPSTVHDFDAGVLNATYWHPEYVWVSK